MPKLLRRLVQRLKTIRIRNQLMCLLSNSPCGFEEKYLKKVTKSLGDQDKIYSKHWHRSLPPEAKFQANFKFLFFYLEVLVTFPLPVSALLSPASPAQAVVNKTPIPMQRGPAVVPIANSRPRNLLGRRGATTPTVYTCTTKQLLALELPLASQQLYDSSLSPLDGTTMYNHTIISIPKVYARDTKVYTRTVADPKILRFSLSCVPSTPLPHHLCVTSSPCLTSYQSDCINQVQRTSRQANLLRC